MTLLVPVAYLVIRCITKLSIRIKHLSSFFMYTHLGIYLLVEIYTAAAFLVKMFANIENKKQLESIATINTSVCNSIMFWLVEQFCVFDKLYGCTTLRLQGQQGQDYLIQRKNACFGHLYRKNTKNCGEK